MEMPPASAAGAGRFRFWRSVLWPFGAGGVRSVKLAPFITNTASTLPTRSMTTKPEGWFWACASATPWAMIRSMSATSSRSGVGVWNRVCGAGGGGGGGGGGTGLPLPPPPPPPQEATSRAAMATIDTLRFT